MPHSTASAPHESDAPFAPDARTGGLRQLIEGLVCLALAVILFRTFQVEGYMISTGSMAPSLLGFHKRVVCPTCGFSFEVGVAYDESVPASGFGRSEDADVRSGRKPMAAVCQNCGQDRIDVSRVPGNQGDQLLVHKLAYQFYSPRRWDVVVFRNPSRPTQAYVKRVAGLPGESIQIIDGDLYADGKIQRKNLATQRAMRILFYDHDYGVRSTQPGVRSPGFRIPRRTPPAVWTSEGQGFTFNDLPGAATGNGPSPAWITYEHGLSDSEPAPVTDRYSYNARRQVAAPVPVRDLMLSLRLAVRQGAGKFAIEMTDGQQVFGCLFDFGANEVRLIVDDDKAPVRSAPLPAAALRGPVLVEMSLMDRQVLVAVEGRPVFAPWRLPRGGQAEEEGRKPLHRPVRLGTWGLAGRVDSLKLFRDVHYTPGRARNGIDEPYELGDEEYFMLGDNSPVSSDSRSWAGGAVHRRLLLGKPFVVHLPSRPGELRFGSRRLHIRIPDPSRVRYIR